MGKPAELNFAPHARPPWTRRATWSHSGRKVGAIDHVAIRVVSRTTPRAEIKNRRSPAWRNGVRPFSGRGTHLLPSASFDLSSIVRRQRDIESVGRNRSSQTSGKRGEQNSAPSSAVGKMAAMRLSSAPGGFRSRRRAGKAGSAAREQSHGVAALPWRKSSSVLLRRATPLFAGRCKLRSRAGRTQPEGI